LAAYWIWSGYPASSDADNFWRVDPRNPYAEPWGGPLAFVYSPAFAEAIGPLTRLPWEFFYKVWQGIALVALAWLVTPIGAVVALLLPFVRADVSGGQIHLWLAVMLAVSVRHPGALSFGLLTKVTPGVSLLWYAARAEWRNLGLALGVTGLIVAVSFAFNPAAWVQWVTLLTESSTRHMTNIAVSEWPVVFRLPIAAGLIVMASWRNRPGAVPLIVCFCLPAIWPSSLALIAAMPRMMRRSAEHLPQMTSVSTEREFA